ncbi:MAG: hypothetical protein GC200_04950 [Tepidisphaera sp.]|nr:hypothetical protein [Tepidisphaera sp.]
MEESRGFAGDVAGGGTGVGVVQFVGEVIDEDGVQGAGGGGEEVGGDEAGAADDGGFEGRQARGDVGAEEPQREGLDGGVVHLGDVTEGDVGRADLTDDGVGGFGVWGEEWRGHGGKLDARREDWKGKSGYHAKCARRGGRCA